MSKIEETARDFERANEELIRFVESCDAAQWQATVPGDGWSVGVDAHHCAVGHALAMSWLDRMRKGEDVPGSSHSHDAMNLHHARDYATVTSEETAGLLRSNGTMAAGYLRGLTPGELDVAVAHGPSGGHRLSVEQLAGAFAGHVVAHLERMRAAIAT